MIRLWKWIPVSILMTMLAGAASAVPINLLFESSTTVGGQFPTLQEYTPDLPIPGTGDIDFATGTGYLSLIDHSIVLDVGANFVPDAQLDITGWSQTITSIDGAGNITSTGGGSIACTDLGGLGGFVCAATPTTVAGWPAANGGLPSSAVIDEIAQTITVVDNSNQQAGTITTLYSYTVVPEPGTALLMGLGLIGMTLRRNRRLA